MTLKQLEVFLAVADTRSFSKGGDQVSLAQSTISQHIRALEDELGARLFDRSATRVSLTEAGQLFYEHAALILGQCRSAIEAVRRFQGLEQAVLRVAASSIPASFLIPDLLGQLSTGWPGIRLELRQGDSREALRLLQDEQVELAIVGLRPESEQLSCRVVGGEQIPLVGRPDWSVATPIGPDQLYGLPLVQREPGSGTRATVEAALIRTGYDLRRLQTVALLGSSEAVRRAVLSGAGVSFVSGMAVAPDLASGRLVELPVAGVRIERQFYLVQRAGCELSPAAAVFAQLLHRETAVTQ